MTEISFYHLTKLPLEKALPRLLERVIEGGHKAVLIAKTGERLALLNKALWTYSTKKFLPHGVEEDGYTQEQPIFLTLKEENPNGADILVTVEGVVPEFMSDFSRCLDMFDGNDEDELKAARDRWKTYKEAGHELTYWQQEDKGGWKNAA